MSPVRIDQGARTGSVRYRGVVLALAMVLPLLGVSCSECQGQACAGAADAGGEPSADARTGSDAAPEQAAPSCDNRLRDQGEEGIDCGGPCIACPFACLYTDTFNDSSFATLASWKCEPSLSLELCQGGRGSSNCGIGSDGEYNCVSQTQGTHHVVEGGVCDEILQGPRNRVNPLTSGPCDDGKQSLTERGTDCGGLCEPCPADQAVCLYEATLVGPQLTIGASPEGWKCKEIEDLQTCRDSTWGEYSCTMTRCSALLFGRHEIVAGPCAEALRNPPADEP